MAELHPVAAAYREVRRTGARDLAARLAAIAAYIRSHPHADASAADKETSWIIARAAREAPDLMWDGVGAPRPSSLAREAGSIPFTPEFQRRTRT